MAFDTEVKLQLARIVVQFQLILSSARQDLLIEFTRDTIDCCLGVI